MTSFIANQVGGVFTPLVAKDKGDISNRGKCAGAQLVNNAQTLAADTVVIGGAAATAKAATKSAKFMRTLTKAFDKFVIGCANMKNGIKGLFTRVPMPVAKTYSSKQIPEFAKKLLKLSSKQKAAALIAIPASLLVNYFGLKNIYKKGQIDQKYTDRAKVENHTKNVLD